MGVYNIVITGIILAIAAYYGTYQWGKSSREIYKKRVIRTMETLDDIKKHAQEFNAKEVIKVTENIYVAIGYAIANSIMIIGPDGLVIVDVTESYETASEIYSDFRKLTNKPITDIIYTHNHADHIYGAKAFIEHEKVPPRIWAHHSIGDAIALNSRGTNKAYYIRAMRQFGVFLPEQVSAGIGFRLRIGKPENTVATQYPTHFLYAAEEDVTMAGIPLTLVHIPGETDDQIGVWIPEQRAFLCADDLYKAFPNLYAIRGTKSRDLKQWVASMDIMIDYEPDMLIPSHTRPVIGHDKVMTLLTEYRDAIQYVHDQTVRLINKGYHPDEIAQMLSLPEHLQNNPYLHEFYGTVAWSAKSVFIDYLGWFSGDPVELNPLTRTDRAVRLVKLIGEEKMVKAADEALKNGDYQWALELSSHVMRTSPGHQDVQRIKVEALIALGARQTSTNGRNYYMTSALEVANDVKIPSIQPSQRAIFVNTFPIEFSLDAFSVLFSDETCSGRNETLFINLTQPESHHFIQIRNSVAIVKHKRPNKWDIKIETSDSVWRGIMSGQKSALSAVAFGDISVEGGTIALASFFRCFDNKIDMETE